MSLSISLVETFITDDGLNSMISTCKDLDALEEMLDIKLELVKKKVHQKAILSIDNVLNNIRNENLNQACSILEKLLFLQSDDTAFAQLQWHINNYIADIQTNKKEKLNVAVNLIISLLKDYCGESKLKLSLEKLFAELITCEDQTEDNKLLNMFVTYILPKCVLYLDKKYLFELVNITVKTERLDVLSSLINLFLCEDLDHEIALLINNEDFYVLVGDGLISRENFFKKQGIYVLKSITDFSINKSNLYNKSELIKLNSVSLEKTKQAWKTYFLLLDFVQEDQLLLDEQSLGLLSVINYLHQFWGIVVYHILLLHFEIDAVLFGVCSMLTSPWFKDYKNFMFLSVRLVNAFARVSYTDFSTKICPLITNFTQNCDEQIFMGLLEASCGVTWSPFVTWAFYKSLFRDCPKFKIPLDLTKSILNHLDTLADEHIRKGCVLLFIKYLCIKHVIVEYTFDDLLDIYQLINKCYSAFHVEIFSYLKPIIISHQRDVLKRVQSWENMKHTSACDVENVMRWSELFPTEVYYPNQEIMNACSSMECVQITDKICVLRKVCTNEQILEYLARRLDNIDDATNIANIENIIHHICAVFKNKDLLKAKLEKKITEILAHNNTNLVKLQIAFEIVIRANSVFHVNDIIRLWLEKYKVHDRNINENIRLKILELYEKIIKQNQRDTIDIDLSKMVECTLEMQNYRAFIYIIQNLTPEVIYNNSSLDIGFITKKIVDGICKHAKAFASDGASSASMKHAIRCFMYNIINTVMERPAGEKKILKVIEEFLCLSDHLSFIDIDSMLAKHLYFTVHTYCLADGNMFLEILIRLLNRNKCVTKNHKVLMEVYKDINAQLEHTAADVPSVVLEHTKMDIIIAILIILKKFDVADYVTDMLIDSYMIHYNEEYCADSVLHEQKLTIAQTLLVIQPFIKNTKKVIDLIITSLCNESHQTNVRQTMQWLLIRLLAANKNCFEIIKPTLTSADASTITTLIPVMYHLTLKTNRQNWNPWMDLLLPLTMSENFESQIYAQTAAENLFEHAKQINNMDFWVRYGTTCVFAARALRTAGDQVCKTLQDDRKLFYDFDPFDDYCMEEVFPGIYGEYWCYEKFESIPGTRKKPRKAKATKEETKDPTELETVNPQNFQHKSFIEEYKPSDVSGDLILVATFVEQPANLGGISRTCEAFRAKQLIVNDSNVRKDKEFRRLSMGSENWLDIVEVKEMDLPTYLQNLKKDGYRIVGVEQTARSVNLNTHKFLKKTVLVLGNEKEGIPLPLIPYMDVCMEIPNVGDMRSLNAYVAGTILIWEYVKQHTVKD